MAMAIKTVKLWDRMLCSVVGNYLFLVPIYHEDDGTKLLQNIGTFYNSASKLTTISGKHTLNNTINVQQQPSDKFSNSMEQSF